LDETRRFEVDPEIRATWDVKIERRLGDAGE
jgi:hypothetical protein